jgi:hypothetical protein
MFDRDDPWRSTLASDAGAYYASTVNGDGRLKIGA